LVLAAVCFGFLPATLTSGHPAAGAAGVSDKLSVTPYNGALLIEWTLATGNARQFNITATPLDASLQWTIPPRQAREAGAVVPGSSTSFFLSHLVADCHTEYVVKVTWTDEAGAEHPLGSAVTARPSGFVGTGDRVITRTCGCTIGSRARRTFLTEIT